MTADNVKHTPGPWEFEDNAIMAACGIHICTPNTVDDYPCIEEGTESDAEAECIANAKLMASAPEILSALKECASGSGFQYMTFEARKRVDDAIAKAEGRS